MVNINGKASNFAEIVDVYIRNAFYYEKPVVVCVGSGKTSGWDSLAPLVGTLLEEEFKIDAYVYGTLREPIHPMSLVSVIEEIRKKFGCRKILTINASLGKTEDVGFFKFSTEGLLPGKNKIVEDFKKDCGDFNIFAVVDEWVLGVSIYKSVMARVWEMARVLSGAIAVSINSKV